MSRAVLPFGLCFVWFVSTLGAERPVVEIAVMGPLTGPSAAYGRSQLRGALLAAERIHDIGTLPVDLRVVPVDDGGESGRVGSLARDLIFERGVVAFIGCVNSACTHVLEMICVKTQKPHITCVSTDPSITRAGSPWTFRGLADDVRQADALARHVLDVVRARRVALVTLDDRYGQMGARTLKRALADAGRPHPFSATFPRGDVPREELARKVREFDPEVVVVWSLYHEGAQVVKALRAAGVRCPLVGPDGLTTPAFLERAGAAADGMVVTQPFDADRPSPRTKDFLDAYRQRWGEDADSFAAHAFDAVQVLALAIRKGGTEAFALREALAATAAYDGVTGVITFDAMGNDTRTVELAVVEKGRFVSMRRHASVRQTR